MVAISVSIILATTLAFWSNQILDSVWLSFTPLFLLLAYLVPRFRLVLIFICSLLWASSKLNLQLEHRLDNAFDGRVVLISGVIADIAQQRRESARFLLIPTSIENYEQVLPKLIRLSWYRNPQLPQAGERWQFRVKLRKPDGFQNPGGFDYQRWLFVQGIGATGYVKASEDTRMLEDASLWSIDHHRGKILKAIQSYCQNCEFRGLFQALAIGFRGDIESSQNRLLQHTGTAHLLAISGMHIGLVAGLFYMLGSRVWCFWLYRYRFNRLEFSAILALVAAAVYAAMAGFSLPTVRALVMLVVVVSALFCRRDVNLLNSVALAASLILIVDPLAVGSASFWLSICALLVIALGQYLLKNQSGRWKRVLIIQGLFSLLFIPLSILLFDQASPAGFLANLLAIPLVSLVILPLVLVASLLAALNLSLAANLFALADILTGWMMRYLDWLLDSGVGVFQNADRPVLLLICAGIGLTVLLLPLTSQLRKPALILVLLPLFYRPEVPDPGEFRLTVLDVGQGTSVFIETRHHSLIYDFGPGNDNGYSAADWVLKPYMRYRGIESADLMIISHVDQDHSGGFVSFEQDYRSAALLSGTPQALVRRFNLKHPVNSCHNYRDWLWDGVRFEFLTVESNSVSTTTNNRSCVLKLTGFQSALLSGDIEADQERLLVTEQAQQLKADLLLVPHHGSLTSSTKAFVDAIQPEAAVFTLGRNNRWGFPKSEVTARYEAIGSRIYRSDIHGAVIISSRAQGMQIETHRQPAKRLWQAVP